MPSFCIVENNQLAGNGDETRCSVVVISDGVLSWFLKQVRETVVVDSYLFAKVVFAAAPIFRNSALVFVVAGPLFEAIVDVLKLLDL